MSLSYTYNPAQDEYETSLVGHAASVTMIANGMARGYGALRETEISPNMAHDMMLEKDWQRVARGVFVWLDEQCS